MFIIRTAFWLAVVVLLLPSDERKQAELYGQATATAQQALTFCQRNPSLCEQGQAFWHTFLGKAQFGARIVMDSLNGGSTASRVAGGSQVPYTSNRPELHAPQAAPSYARPYRNGQPG